MINISSETVIMSVLARLKQVFKNASEKDLGQIFSYVETLPAKEQLAFVQKLENASSEKEQREIVDNTIPWTKRRETKRRYGKTETITKKRTFTDLGEDKNKKQKMKGTQFTFSEEPPQRQPSKQAKELQQLLNEERKDKEKEQAKKQQQIDKDIAKAQKKTAAEEEKKQKDIAKAQQKTAAEEEKKQKEIAKQEEKKQKEIAKQEAQARVKELQQLQAQQREQETQQKEAELKETQEQIKHAEEEKKLIQAEENRQKQEDKMAAAHKKKIATLERQRAAAEKKLSTMKNKGTTHERKVQEKLAKIKAALAKTKTAARPPKPPAATKPPAAAKPTPPPTPDTISPKLQEALKTPLPAGEFDDDGDEPMLESKAPEALKQDDGLGLGFEEGDILPEDEDAPIDVEELFTPGAALGAQEDILRLTTDGSSSDTAGDYGGRGGSEGVEGGIQEFMNKHPLLAYGLGTAIVLPALRGIGKKIERYITKENKPTNVLPKKALKPPVRKRKGDVDEGDHPQNKDLTSFAERGQPPPPPTPPPTPKPPKVTAEVYNDNAYIPSFNWNIKQSNFETVNDGELLGQEMPPPSEDPTKGPYPAQVLPDPVDRSTDTLRPRFGVLGGLDVTPSAVDQLASDIRFDMFSFVQPGHGNGRDNKLFANQQYLDRVLTGLPPNFTPRDDIGRLNYQHPMPWQWQPIMNFRKAQQALYRQVDTAVKVGKLSRQLGEGSAQVLGRDVPEVIESVSSQGLPRDPRSVFEPSIQNSSPFHPVLDPAGNWLKHRGFRRLFSPWREPQAAERQYMSSGPHLNKRRALEVVMP